jgi:CheY-like chemotaxis protein
LPVISTSLHGLPVLVVDDNATMRTILQEMLSQWGMKPTLVATEEAALAAWQRASRAGLAFGVAIVDARGPGQDGFNLVQKLRNEAGKAIPVVMMLSSAGQRQELARCRQLEVASYASKPIRQRELFHAIQAALGTPVASGSSSPNSSAGSFAPQRLHVLVAEDNRVNQQLAARLLEKRGHKVSVVSSGREALDLLEHSHYDVVLMDLQMPEMSGLEVTAAIRRREKGTRIRVPIVALTAHAMAGDRERCLAAGMDGYLSKPLRPSELNATLANLVPSIQPSEMQPPPVPANPQVLDRSAALKCVDGDHELLGELAQLFLDNCPRFWSDLDEALAAGDAAKVQRLAHNLKGSLANFGAGAATAVVRELEEMARAADLKGVAETLTSLRMEMERLSEALSEFIPQAHQS